MLIYSGLSSPDIVGKACLKDGGTEGWSMICTSACCFGGCLLMEMDEYINVAMKTLSTHGGLEGQPIVEEGRAATEEPNETKAYGRTRGRAEQLVDVQVWRRRW